MTVHSTHTAVQSTTNSAAETTLRLLNYIESQNYKGYDPYDALNSRLIKLISCKSKWLRIIFTQFLRRCPINVRPVLRVKKEHNPKAIGLFLWGYSKLFAIQKNEDQLESIEKLLDLLEQLRSKGYSGNCWGYNFDWQSRTYLRPKGVPTIVNTAFIGHALLDCYEKTAKQRALDMALSIHKFVLKDLHRSKEGESFCFSYTPVDRAIVHNANLLGASILIRLNRYLRDSEIEDSALASLSYSMRYQREDGSWYYAETPHQKWIDSFHTGFNLQALRYCLAEGVGKEYRPQYEKGVRYYAETFFLADGTPKYYHDKTYPLDIHCPTQAVVFFSGLQPEYKELTERILQWMLVNLWSDKGYFYFRKHANYMNRIPYMRWSQAWAFHALTEYLSQSRGGYKHVRNGFRTN